MSSCSLCILRLFALLVLCVAQQRKTALTKFLNTHSHVATTTINRTPQSVAFGKESVPLGSRLPKSLQQLFQQFSHVYVLCMRCDEFEREVLVWWPLWLKKKTSLFDGSMNDKKYSQVEDHYMKASLAHLDIIKLSAQKRYKSVVVIEEDAMFREDVVWSESESESLQRFISSDSWQILRLGYNALNACHEATCPAACACVKSELSANFCQTHKKCDLRNTVAYAVSERAYPVFEAQRESSMPDNDREQRTIDVWMWQELPQYLLVPPLVAQAHKRDHMGAAACFLRKCLH